MSAQRASRPQHARPAGPSGSIVGVALRHPAPVDADPVHVPRRQTGYSLVALGRAVRPRAGVDLRADLGRASATRSILAVVTVLIVLLLLLPTMILVEAALPAAAALARVRRACCRSPIPAIVLVVGLAPGVLGGGARSSAARPWTLAFAIGIIVLPYAYRPIQAIASTPSTS